MTPQEIVDHKLTWMPGTAVSYHSDLKWQAKDWLKSNVPQQSFKHIMWTNVYEHTVLFEDPADAKDFDSIFGSER